jgi:hypothetical protein
VFIDARVRPKLGLSADSSSGLLPTNLTPFSCLRQILLGGFVQTCGRRMASFSSGA